MTNLSDEALHSAPDIPLDKKEKIPPEITSDEDVPFGNGGASVQPEDLSQVLDIEKKFSWKKLSIGSSALGWSIFLMFLCVVLSIWKPDNSLIKDAFDAFRLIALTVLGYIFGSNSRQ